MALPGLSIVTPGTSGGKLKILVYGKRGTGKTLLASTAQDHPDMGPVLHLAAEPSDATIEHRGDIARVHLQRIFMSDKHPNEVSLEQYVRLYHAGNEELLKYKTWCVDSLTELQEKQLDELRESKGNVFGQLTLQDYGTSTNKLKWLFRALRDLPVNIIFTALTADVVVGQGMQQTVKGIRPAMTKKLAEMMMSYVDHVWLLDVVKNPDDKTELVRWLFTQPDPDYEAKTRGPVFAKLLDDNLGSNPTMPEVYDLYLQSVNQ